MTVDANGVAEDGGGGGKANFPIVVAENEHRVCSRRFVVLRGE